LRVLALAIRRVPLEEATQILRANKSTAAEADLILVGLIGLIDPPK
jgi:magnesium-transporting ATPase (P-type)